MLSFDRFEGIQWLHVFLGLLLLWVIRLIAQSIYNITLHPLRSYPGPLLARATDLPFVWNLLRGDQVVWITGLHERYGPVVRAAPGELSFISEAAWKDIYGHDSPSAGRKWQEFYNPMNPQLQTMQGADDKTHAELRRIFDPAFSEKNLRSQEPLLKSTAQQMVDRITRFDTENPGQPIDVSKFFMYVTFDIMGFFAFSHTLGMIERMEYLRWIDIQYKSLKAASYIFSAAYLRVLRWPASFISWLVLEKFNITFEFARDQVDKRLERAKPEEGNDLWALIFRENKFKRKLQRRDMYTHAMLFLLAGTETSATAMTALLYYLTTNLSTYDRLVSEIRSAFATIDDIAMQRCVELPYLQACLEEVLRIYPPVQFGLPRVTPPIGQPIDGQYVPGETVVYVSQFAANMSPTNFRSPRKFVPERWLADNQDFASDRRGVRQPFIVGARNCIGQTFAYHEMRIVIAYLLFSFDVELTEEGKSWGNNQKTYLIAEKLPLFMNLAPRKQKT